MGDNALRFNGYREVSTLIMRSECSSKALLLDLPKLTTLTSIGELFQNIQHIILQSTPISFLSLLDMPSLAHVSRVDSKTIGNDRVVESPFVPPSSHLDVGALSHFFSPLCSTNTQLQLVLLLTLLSVLLQLRSELLLVHLLAVRGIELDRVLVLFLLLLRLFLGHLHLGLQV